MQLPFADDAIDRSGIDSSIRLSALLELFLVLPPQVHVCYFDFVLPVLMKQAQLEDESKQSFRSSFSRESVICCWRTSRDSFSHTRSLGNDAASFV